MVKNFETCSSAKEMLAFFQDEERFFHHTKYFHYTTLEKLESILTHKTLRFSWLGHQKNWNDKNERDWYQKNIPERNVFSLCFSTGTSESIPLWYLYSGISGRGARIVMTKAIIQHLCSVDEAVLTETNTKREIKIRRSKGDFEIVGHDILYIGKDGSRNTYRLKYGFNGIKNGWNAEDADFLREKYGRFTKDLIWFYEKETRLQISVKKDLLDPGGEYVVDLSIEDILPKVKICLAPELGINEREKLLLKPWTQGLKPNQFQMSEYAGMIEMNLERKTNLTNEHTGGGTLK